jgi:hypothetical protein
VLQAFIDDSYDDDVFVLAGYIARAEAWARFAKAWEEFLPWGTLKSDSQRHFKMSEMAQSEQGMERWGAFYRVIEDHVLLALSITVFKKDVERAQRRIFVNGYAIGWTNVNMKGFDNFYCLCVYLLFSLFNKEREDVAAFVPNDAPIDF